MCKFDTHAKKCTLDGLNQKRANNQLILYTPEYGTKTKTNGLGTEVIIEDGVVVSKGSNDNVIPLHGMILSGSGLAKDWIEDCIPVGAKVVYHPHNLSVEVL